jgi:hypothetical protein
MNLSKFVLNKINFESTKIHHSYLDLFQQLVPIQKNSIVHDSPHKIRNDIGNDITLRTFIQLCIWKNCNVWIIHNHICFHIGTFPPTHVVEKTILPWSNQLYDNHHHVVYPMHAISHYKVEELKIIATNLDVPISKNKKQLYTDIILKID